jgi:hypothetical protein
VLGLHRGLQLRGVEARAAQAGRPGRRRRRRRRRLLLGMQACVGARGRGGAAARGRASAAGVAALRSAAAGAPAPLRAAGMRPSAARSSDVAVRLMVNDNDGSALCGAARGGRVARHAREPRSRANPAA